MSIANLQTPNFVSLKTGKEFDFENRDRDMLALSGLKNEMRALRAWRLSERSFA